MLYLFQKKLYFRNLCICKWYIVQLCSVIIVLVVGDIWVSSYNPLHVLLRAMYRKDFQASMDRYTK